jgi:hypothetical protein
MFFPVEVVLDLQDEDGDLKIAKAVPMSGVHVQAMARSQSLRVRNPQSDCGMFTGEYADAKN